MDNYGRFVATLNGEKPDRILTYDFWDNEDLLVEFGGYDKSKTYTLDELVSVNVKAFKNVGLDVTRSVHDPASDWMGMGDKITNWVRFFGVDPDNWEVARKGGTTWISKRPFTDLKGLEKHMPNPPVFEEVSEWCAPLIQFAKAVFGENDLVFVGGVEGPITDGYTYTDMELFMTAMFDAPELVSHLMDCTAKFSAYIAQAFAENASSPLLFMGEDIAFKSGPMFSPQFLLQEGLPRWKRIMDPIKEKGFKFLFHTDGRYGDALSIIFDELGADGLNPIERCGCNDIFEIHEQYPDKLLFGNVCCSVTLPRGNVYDVEDETLEIIERIGPDGGIFIGSSSEVHGLVPVENAAAMYRTVHEYGTYPIDVERIRRRRAEIRDNLITRKNVSL